MTMTSTAAHPEPERLAALAGGDPDAEADVGLRAHVTACEACADEVRQLRALHAALGELPDVAPSRPLRYLPPVVEPAARGRGWRLVARRMFAPVAVAGVLLIVVSGVGAAGALGPADAFRWLSLSAQVPAADVGEESGAPTDASGEGAFGPAAESPGDGGTRGAEGTEPNEEPEPVITPTERTGWFLLGGMGVGMLILAVVLRRSLAPI
jgi:hypothetical protein